MALDLSGHIARKTIIKIGTDKFTFTELNLADLAEVKTELSKERKALNDERRERLLADAAKIGSIDPLELLKYSDSSVSPEEVEAHMDTVEGLGLLAYLSLRYHHPGISKDNVMKIITPFYLDSIVEAMFPEETEKNKKKPAVQTPKKSRKLQQ